MPRYSSGGRSTGGSTTLPICALVGGTTTRPIVREIGLTNTTSLAVAVNLARLTSAGTPGTATTVAPYVTEGSAAVGAARNTYSSTAPTLGADLGYRTVLPGSIGAGIIWTFSEPGLAIPMTAAAAVAVMLAAGTVQFLDWYFMWDE